MNWKEIYTSKLKSMEDAVKVVKSGDKVVIGHAVVNPLSWWIQWWNMQSRRIFGI